MKALAIAAANGQKIYTLNSQNRAYHQAIVQGLGTDADTKAEIANALNAGMEVTVHQSDITAYGWTGSGYVILDPETGAGAYKISGGANGAFLFAVLAAISIVLLGIALDVLIPLAVVTVILSGVLIGLNNWIQNYLKLTAEQQLILNFVEVFSGLVFLVLFASFGMVPLAMAALTGLYADLIATFYNLFCYGHRNSVVCPFAAK